MFVMKLEHRSKNVLFSMLDVLLIESHSHGRAIKYH